MKKILIWVSFLVLPITVFGQAQESTIPQLKNEAAKMMAAKIDLPYAPQVVIEALQNYVWETGRGKARKATGYQLSENTLLVNKNSKSADMHFFVILKNTDNPNETVLYLNLESFTKDYNNNEVAYVFAMQDAKDYLDNLELAIKHPATDLQVQLQNKNLAQSKAKSLFLVQEARDLNSQQQGMKSELAGNNTFKKNERLTKKLDRVNQKIDINGIQQANQEDATLKQGVALALLLNRIKNQPALF